MSSRANNCQFSEYSHNDCMCTNHLSWLKWLSVLLGSDIIKVKKLLGEVTFHPWIIRTGSVCHHRHSLIDYILLEDKMKLSSVCFLMVMSEKYWILQSRCYFLCCMWWGESLIIFFKFKRELSEDCYNFKRDDKLALEYYNQNYHRQWFDFCKNIRIFKQKTTTWKKCQKLSLSIAYRLNFIVLMVDNIYRYKIKVQEVESFQI